jgi:hypothetical protein
MKRNTRLVVLAVIGAALIGLAMKSAHTSPGRIAERAIERNLPPAPIQITYRKALLGSGYVLMLKNTSGSSQNFAVTLRNPTTKAEKRIGVPIDANKTVEIGHLEGWTATAGDTVDVALIGYQTEHQTLTPQTAKR